MENEKGNGEDKSESENAFDRMLRALNLESVVVTCETHGEQSALVPPGMNPGSMRCPACVHLESVRADRDRHAKERADHLVRIATVPDRFATATMGGLQDHCPEVTHAKRMIGTWFQGMVKEPTQWAPLILSGPPGTGKTHLMCAITNNLIHAGVGCRYVTLQTMLSEIKMAYSKPELTEAGEINKFVSNFSVLLLDEVDVMRGTENDLALIFAVVNGRYNNLRNVVIAMNQLPANLGGMLTHRVASRLGENATTVFTDWRDWRA